LWDNTSDFTITTQPFIKKMENGKMIQISLVNTTKK